MDRIVLLLTGKLILFCGAFQLIPWCYSLYLGHDDIVSAFSASILIALLTGIWFLGKGEKHGDSMNAWEGSCFLFFSWWILSLFGALPYYFSEHLHFAGAIFESISCFTTTGISNYAGDMDIAVILWRSLSQWLGGYFVFLQLCTLLPVTSGCFGISFVLPGNMRTGAISQRRLQKTAGRILKIYLVVSLVGMALYELCGVSVFDAMNLAMVTISTGGCYTPDASVSIDGWFTITAFLGILTSGCNILLYWQAFSRGEIRIVKQTFYNSETRIFFLLLFVFTTVIGLHLYSQGMYSLGDSMANSLFHVVSFACTNGVMVDQMLHWPGSDKFLLICLALIGGCVGSLAGGFKIFRLQVLAKSAYAEMKRSLHPNMVVRIVVDGKSVPHKTIERILTYFFLYFSTIVVSMLFVSLAGMSMQQTADIVVSCLTSTGQMMLFHSDYEELQSLPDYIKMICCVIMIIGKINIFTLLLLLNGGWSKLKARG